MEAIDNYKEPSTVGEKLVAKTILLPFILVTSCFVLWGFANDITNPMVAAFQKIFLTGATEATLIQVAFYGGYGAMAIPAALFIRRFSYKAGILMGLALYAMGGLLFIPATSIGEFYPFLLAYFVITCGLSFLETTANPYILSMGSAATATQRLNLAQAFNPMGSLIGMYTASQFILVNLDERTKAERALLPLEEFNAVKTQDLEIVSQPYLFIALVIALIFIFIALAKMPEQKSESEHKPLKTVFANLIKSRNYTQGVIAQMFYVGAQIMCWTFIIHYGTEVFMQEGMSEKQAQILSQEYNILAMVLFCTSRFICTYLLKFIQPGLLLLSLAIAGGAFTLGTITLDGRIGLYCLVAISACMSLMFPTIYGIALKGLQGDEAKFAAAGLIMAIVGGTFLPMLQASVIDNWTGTIVTAVQASFALPVVCFVIIAAYGYQTIRAKSI